jgi:FixJ family two-component response regulator
VFVVNSDASARRALKSLIGCAGWQPRLFGTAREFLAHPRSRVPSCLLLAVELPDSSGFDLQARVSAHSDLPVIFTAEHPDVPTTVRAIKAGAIEFFAQPWDPGVLLRAIGQALERSRAALERQSERGALEAGYASLSRREREVMALVVSGLLNKQVGSELGISEFTVKAHRGQVMRKMKAGSFAGLVRMAAALSLEPEPAR